MAGEWPQPGSDLSGGDIMTHSVLLVDDDADVLNCLGRMLRNQPYRLYTARCGEEAVSTLKARKVDVIVVDERMPGMSGTDVLAWVAANYPDVVRIMLTGHAITETAIRAINEGHVYYFFTKPCHETHLAVMIRKALEHKGLLARQEQLLEITEQQAADRQQFTEDLEVLDRLISRDLKKPLHAVAQSCQSLMEQHRDLFDRKAESLIESTLEAVSDMRYLVEKMQGRIRVWEPPGRRSQSCTEPEATVPTA